MEFNQSKADAFANRLFGALNEGALCLMTSIGHRTGLFDTMAELPPSTSGEIARKAGLNERYVREWLGAMTTGRVVDYDAATGAYSLPPEHAAFLSRKGTPKNVAVFAQYIPLLGSVEDEIVDCFQRGEKPLPGLRSGAFQNAPQRGFLVESAERCLIRLCH